MSVHGLPIIIAYVHEPIPTAELRCLACTLGFLCRAYLLRALVIVVSVLVLVIVVGLGLCLVLRQHRQVAPEAVTVPVMVPAGPGKMWMS
jgi:uncharacterized membrane protein